MTIFQQQLKLRSFPAAFGTTQLLLSENSHLEDGRWTPRSNALIRHTRLPPWTAVRANLLQSCPTLCNPMDCSPPGSSIHAWDSPGKNTGVECHFLLQGIFPTQGLNGGLLHYRQLLYCLSYQGLISPKGNTEIQTLNTRWRVLTHQSLVHLHLRGLSRSHKVCDHYCSFLIRPSWGVTGHNSVKSLLHN